MPRSQVGWTFRVRPLGGRQTIEIVEITSVDHPNSIVDDFELGSEAGRGFTARNWARFLCGFFNRTPVLRVLVDELDAGGLQRPRIFVAVSLLPPGGQSSAANLLMVVAS
jgi:hypothetical protein